MKLLSSKPDIPINSWSPGIIIHYLAHVRLCLLVSSSKSEIHILNMENSFHFHYSFQKYFRCNLKINKLFSRILFGGNENKCTLSKALLSLYTDYRYSFLFVYVKVNYYNNKRGEYFIPFVLSLGRTPI